jgi:hypothetical protein
MWGYTNNPVGGIQKTRGFVSKTTIDFLAGNEYNNTDTLCGIMLFCRVSGYTKESNL